jgi:hypothetical protein
MAIPSTVPKAWVASEFVRAIMLAQRDFNRHLSDEGKLRLRVAVDHGEVIISGQYVSGDPVTCAARLCDSGPARAALAASPLKDLALIVSDGFYRDVVQQTELDLDPAEFHQVEISVKEFRGVAWVYGHVDTPTEGNERPADQSPQPLPPSPTADGGRPATAPTPWSSQTISVTGGGHHIVGGRDVHIGREGSRYDR